jgi:hypothetical protein
MNTLSVSPEVTITYNPTGWRLIRAASPLVIANSGGIMLDSDFAASLGRSQTVIPREIIQQVQAAQSEDGWVLYVAVDGEWLSLFQSEADLTEAANALSAVLNPPAVDPKPEQKVDLRPLPIEVERWKLGKVGGGVRWSATGKLMRQHAFRVIFFSVSVVVFVLLGAGSRESGLAPVTPSWLPYMAYGVAAVLGYSSLENLWMMLTPRQVIFDDANQEIRSQRAVSGIVDWRLPMDSIEYVLVSQERARSQGRRSFDDPMLISQDGWIHLFADGKFYMVAEVEGVMGRSWDWETIRTRNADGQRYPLLLHEYDTPLHHAALHIANLLSVDVHVDIR